MPFSSDSADGATARRASDGLQAPSAVRCESKRTKGHSLILEPAIEMFGTSLVCRLANLSRRFRVFVASTPALFIRAED